MSSSLLDVAFGRLAVGRWKKWDSLEPVVARFSGGLMPRAGDFAGVAMIVEDTTVAVVLITQIR